MPSSRIGKLTAQVDVDVKSAVVGFKDIAQQTRRVREELAATNVMLERNQRILRAGGKGAREAALQTAVLRRHAMQLQGTLTENARESARFERQLGKLGGRMRSTRGQSRLLRTAMRNLKGVLVALGGGVTTSLFVRLGREISAFAQETAEASKELVAWSVTLNTSSRDVEVFRNQLRLFGIQGAVINTFFGTFARKLEEARRGGGAAFEAYRRLGISLGQLRRATPVDAFNLLAGAVQRAGIQGAELAKVLSEVGEVRSGRHLAPALGATREEFERTRKEAEALTTSWDKHNKAVAAVQSQYVKMNIVVEQSQRQLVLEHGPTIVELTTFWEKLKLGVQGALLSVIRFATYDIADAMEDWEERVRRAADGVSTLQDALVTLGERIEDLSDRGFTDLEKYRRQLRELEDAGRGMFGAWSDGAKDAYQDAIRLLEALEDIEEQAEQTRRAAELALAAALYIGPAQQLSQEVPPRPALSPIDLIRTPELGDMLLGNRQRIFLRQAGRLMGDAIGLGMVDEISMRIESDAARDRFMAAFEQAVFGAVGELPDVSNLIQSAFVPTGEEMEELGEKAKAAAELTKRAWEGVGDVMADLIRTTRSWEDLLRNVAALTVQFLAHLGGGGTGLRSFFAQGGVPGLQYGGPAHAGRAYLVGERGPELFVPRATGDVHPTAGGGASGPTVVNVQVDGSPDTSALIASLEGYFRSQWRQDIAMAGGI